MDLAVLNKSSAKLATFAVALQGGRVFEYSYTQKKDNKRITAHRFEVHLVGQKAESYCLGFIKGPKRDCEKAKEEYKDGSMWLLSKVVLDNYTPSNYISTPVPYRVELNKSTLKKMPDNSGAPQPALHPVPPRTVADVAGINTPKTTDLLAFIKVIGPERTTANGHQVAHVQLLDDSKIGQELAIVTVGVFGKDKLTLLKQHIGSPMVFFNLSVSCSQGSIVINHYENDVVVPAPACDKTSHLKTKEQQLANALNVKSLTTEFTPHAAKDVSGPQALSCAAFLDYARDNPAASVPDVMQLMWVHIEEPESGHSILDATQQRIWYLAQLRDVSGATTVGMPERHALQLASCTSSEQFRRAHEKNSLNMPLLCHVRLSRSIRVSDTGTHFINCTVEQVVPVSYSPTSAPNAAYEDLVKLLNACPPHNEGILFAYLSDIHADPNYGFKVTYDGAGAPRSACVLSLVASSAKSSTISVGEGFQVTTPDVLDYANPASAPQPSVSLVGYCTMDALPGFRIDPPRGRAHRFAMCSIIKREDDTFHVHKLEYIEPDQIEDAVRCFQKLRSLCKRIQPVSTEKRSRTVAACSDVTNALQKKARTLTAVPTDASLG